MDQLLSVEHKTMNKLIQDNVQQCFSSNILACVAVYQPSR